MRSGFRTGNPVDSTVLGQGRQFVGGYYYTGMLTANDGMNTLTQNLEYAIRFEVGATATFDRIGIEVTTGAASSVVRLGIRQSSTAGVAGTLILDAGTIDSSTTGFKEITISQTLTRGRYWLTCALQTAAGVQVRVRNNPDPFLPQAVTTTYNASSIYQLGATGALAATYTLAGPANLGPKIMMRAA